MIVIGLTHGLAHAQVSTGVASANHEKHYGTHADIISSEVPIDFDDRWWFMIMNTAIFS